MKDKICIFHASCADGFGAAYAVWKKFGWNCDYHPGIYGETPPDVRGRDVFIVDFSYKRDVVKEMIKKARSFIILDHHKTAIEDLEGLVAELPEVAPGVNYEQVLDTNRSGAMIAWNFFHGDVEPPQLLKHIQDRDLWEFKMRNTKEVSAALSSHPYDFQIWDDLMYAPIADLISAGASIERKHHKDVKELVSSLKHNLTIMEIKVPAVNLPWIYASDAGHAMAQEQPFAAIYYINAAGQYVVSLRSATDGIDVSQIAKHYGGGGHRHAAGFTVSPEVFATFKGE